MTLVAPPAPAAPVVTAGDGLVTLVWTAPEFDPATMRAVVGYVLRPYIGTTAQPPLNFDASVAGTTVTIAQDGDGVDLVNGTSYTFTVAAISSVGLGLFSPHSVAVTPSPTSQVAITAESWDYSTVRLAFSLTQEMRDKLADARKDGHVPRIAITRSGYGLPTTPKDGARLLDMTVDDALALPYHFDLNDTLPPDDAWVRPNSSEASLYDRNLQPGRWYYYTLFLFLGTEWDSYASDSALVPVDYAHRERLWESLPDYYRVKDQELLGAGQTEGDLRRFLNIFGFELDYSRTLAEGVQDIYQVEKANSTLVQMLGETNLGSVKEEGLGEIRYRALVSVLTLLYEERGTERGVKNLASVTSKYRTKVLGGINRMRESDDSEFSTGFDEPEGTSSVYPLSAVAPWKPLASGNWAPPYLTLIQGIAPKTGNNIDFGTPFIGGLNYRQIRGNMTSDEFHASVWPVPVEWPDSPSDKKIGGLIDLKGYASDIHNPHPSGTILVCGAGVARTGDRFHNLVPRPTYPSTHGIRCTPGNYYDWSVYSEKAYALGSHPARPIFGSVGIGVLWFGAPHGVNADDLREYPFDNDDVTHSVDLPGFKPQYQKLKLPPFQSLGYISRDERVWTRDAEALSGYPFPVTVDDQTDIGKKVYDPTTGMLNPKRYSMRTIAPLPLGPEDFVYAVPYLAFSDSRVARYIGCAMFNEESNPRNKYIITRRVDPVHDDVSDGLPVEVT